MQVTATFNGQEISIGEGDSYIYAVEECMAGVDSIFLDALDDIQLEFIGAGAGANLPRYARMADYYYAPRQYF